VDILLRDTANLMQQDADRANRRAGDELIGPVKPLFGIAEVEATMKLFRPLDYAVAQQVASGNHDSVL
jgi:hypothetical protein